MNVAETALYLAARTLYRTGLGSTEEMRQAPTNLQAYHEIRGQRARKPFKALNRYGISIEGKAVADFGCGGGGLLSAVLEAGAATLVGIDLKKQSLEIARARYSDERLTFIEGEVGRLPLPSNSVDVLISFAVFEHVAAPLPILKDIHRILRPGGRAVISALGWGMPFAPHLWAVMPVPRAHVFVSERTLLRVCKRLYEAPWYNPTMQDIDGSGA